MKIQQTQHKDVVTVVEKDVLGGGKFTLDTGVYDLTIRQMYMVQNAGGSYSMQLVLETPDKKLYSPSIYFMDKTGDYTTISNYGDTKGKRVNTIGYDQLDTICKFAVGKSLVEVQDSAQTKTVIKQFSKDQEKINVEMFMDVIGAKIQMAIEERRVNKTADSGQLKPNGTKLYVPTNEDRLENVHVKIFNEAGYTTEELASNKPATFRDLWIEKKAGILVDKFKPVTGGVSTGVPKQTSASAF